MPMAAPTPFIAPGGAPNGGVQTVPQAPTVVMAPVLNNTTGQVINQTLSDADKKQIKDRYNNIISSIKTPDIRTFYTSSDNNSGGDTDIPLLYSRYIRLRPPPDAGDGSMKLSQVLISDNSGNKIGIKMGIKVKASSTAQGSLSPENLFTQNTRVPARVWPSIWKTVGNNRDKEFLDIDLGAVYCIRSVAVVGVSSDPQSAGGIRIEVKIDHAEGLAIVSNPAPTDPIPITFPKDISMYALAKFQSPATARGALMIDYNNLQNEMATVIYDPAIRAAWSTDASKETCSQLNTLYTTFKNKQKRILARTQDISGAINQTGMLHDDSIKFQTSYQSVCLQTPMSDACKNLASQDGPLFSLLAQYNTSQYDLYSGQIDISDNLQTISDVYTILKCTRPADMSMPTGNELGTIDTTVLTAKLQSFSPYYLSPDILQNIVRSIVSANDIGGTLQYTSDTLVNINQIVNNIKTLTNTP